MNWQIALSIAIFANTASIILITLAAKKLREKSWGIFFQYLFCVPLVFLYAFYSKELIFKPLIFLLGFFVALGAYFQWKAQGISQSKTVLFIPVMNIITLALAMAFLEEADSWNLKLVSGISLCFFAMYLLGRSYNKKENGISKVSNKVWLFFTLSAVAIFGVAQFLLKYFTQNGLPRGAFLLGWYGGAFLGSILILWFETRFKKSDSLSKTTILITLLLSLFIVGNILGQYLSYQLGGKVSLVVPLQGLITVAIPLVVGLFLFKEGKGVSKLEIVGFLTGGLGAVLILLN
ncbi:MAG: hypothetical protein PHF44_03035 [Candidatus Pacebacteria bacterium]|nr:hypothetical protein [Candidatus Paceibacterota bacterium]